MRKIQYAANFAIDLFFQALVSVLVSLLPAFVVSFFVPPGASGWVVYVLAPILFLCQVYYLWWPEILPTFSKKTRGVQFLDRANTRRYENSAPLPRQRVKEQPRTNQRRAAGKGASIRLAASWAYGVVTTLCMLALSCIPFVGFLFTLLGARVRAKGDQKIAAAREHLQRSTAPTLDELRAFDPRPPVLLLRSFADDILRVDFGKQIADRYLSDRRKANTTFEEMVADEAAGWGPFIAIGDPQEILPPLGAARAYFTHDTWQAAATELLRAAKVVVLIMGLTPSVGWELERILQAGYAPKTLILIPPTSFEEYLVRLVKVSGLISQAFRREWFPKMTGRQRLAAIVFDENGFPLPIVAAATVPLIYEEVLDLASKTLAFNAGEHPAAAASPSADRFRWDRVYVAGHENYWSDSDCEDHSVTEYNLVRLYRDGTVVGRRIELREKRPADASGPVPWPADQAVAEWIDRARPDTFSLRGTYRVDGGDEITFDLGPGGQHDLKIERYDLKYWGKDTPVEKFLQPGVYRGKMTGETIEFPGGITLSLLAAT